MCIKLVKYWDKYTEMHGQQNVKKFATNYFYLKAYQFLKVLGLVLQNRITNWTEMGILEEEPWRWDSLTVPKRRQATADKICITA